MTAPDTRSPVLTSSWDCRRRSVTHKVTIAGTSRFLLFDDEALRDLREQIDTALKGADDDRTHNR